LPTVTCSGLHPDVLDAIDAVAASWPRTNHELIAHARKAFQKHEATGR
jgi:hypothetical protein